MFLTIKRFENNYLLLPRIAEEEPIQDSKLQGALMTRFITSGRLVTMPIVVTSLVVLGLATWFLT